MSQIVISLQNDIKQLDKLSVYADNPHWKGVISNRVNVIQSRVNNLRRLAEKKDARVKDWMLSQLDNIQVQIDSIIWTIE